MSFLKIKNNKETSFIATLNKRNWYTFFFFFFFKMTFKNPEMHIGETIEMKGFQPGLSDLTLLKIVLVVWQANCWTLLWQYQHWLLVHSGHVRSQGLYINGNWLKKQQRLYACVCHSASTVYPINKPHLPNPVSFNSKSHSFPSLSNFFFPFLFL